MEKEVKDMFRDLAARNFALQAGLIAVIQTHPHPQALKSAMIQAEDAGMSNMIYKWEDQHLETYRKTVQQLSDQIPPG